MLQYFFMRLRGTDTKAFKAAEARALAAGINLAPAQIEAHLMSGGDMIAVIDAMADARRRGLPDNFAAISEAQLAKVDLHAFVAGGYQAHGFESQADLRRAATTDPEAAHRLATELLDSIDQLAAVRARGPRGIAERLAWKAMNQSLADHQQSLRAEVEKLLPVLRPDAERTARTRLGRGA